MQSMVTEIYFEYVVADIFSFGNSGSLFKQKMYVLDFNVWLLHSHGIIRYFIIVELKSGVRHSLESYFVYGIKIQSQKQYKTA